MKPILTLIDDLVERVGLFYKKFNPVKRWILLLIRQPGHHADPFTGNITGKEQGTIRNGKKEGPWVRYHDNGQVSAKGNYKDGKDEGPWVWYHDNGQVSDKVTSRTVRGKVLGSNTPKTDSYI